MQSFDASIPPSRSAHVPRAERPRRELYAAVHKGLRAAMFDALVRLGATATDDAAWADTGGRVRELLLLLAQHLEEEDRFLESAIAARLPGRARITADDHRRHEASLAALQRAIAAVDAAPAAARGPRLRDLYLDLSAFVAENLEHMRQEETENQAALWSAYSDEELVAIERELVASIPPERSRLFLSWMLPSMGPGEREAFLAEARAGAPRPVFLELVGLARATLSQEAFASLSSVLGADLGD